MQRPVKLLPEDLDQFYEILPDYSTENSANPNDNHDDEDDIIHEPVLLSARLRQPRRSVRGESFNPEQFLAGLGENNKVVYPKTDEQRKRLADCMKSIFLFRSLDSDQIQEILDAMFERNVLPSEFVIHQGDDGDYFYVIDRGVFNVYISDETEVQKIVGHYENCGSFGELALMYSTPRAATVQAVTGGSLWVLDRSTFCRIVVHSAYQKRRNYEELLKSVPVLRGLTDYERTNLADALIRRSLDAGSLVIRQGEEANGMYFVESGSVKVTVTGKNGEEVTVSSVSQGGYFGELALVTHRSRAASVYCSEPVQLAFLDVDAFERLLGPCMELMKRNMADYETQLSRIFGAI